MKKILVFTSTRADYGILRPLLKKLLEFHGFSTGVLVSGTHLVLSFGNTIEEIVKDRIPIWDRVEILVNSDTSMGTLKSTALALLGFGESLSRIKPDIAIVLGDRFEAFAFGTAATILGIPLAHLHGGEITEGAIDETYRHCLTKMSQLHFTSTENYRQNVIQMGEDPTKVFNVGALGLDNIQNMTLLNKSQLEAELSLDFSLPLVMITFHPETATNRSASDDIKYLLSETLLEPVNIILTYANADPGGMEINKVIDSMATLYPGRIMAFKSLGTLRYFSVARYCSVVAGNSSSGIIEIPSLGVPTINIGDRQKGRISGPSVYHCSLDNYRNTLVRLLKDNPTYSENVNIYGDGKTADRIIEKLIGINTSELCSKKFYHIRNI